MNWAASRVAVHSILDLPAVNSESYPHLRVGELLTQSRPERVGLSLCKVLLYHLVLGKGWRPKSVLLGFLSPLGLEG